MLAMVAKRPKAAAGLASFRVRSDIRTDLSGEPAAGALKVASLPQGAGGRKDRFFGTS
jgi:hypothetical protein